VNTLVLDDRATLGIGKQGKQMMQNPTLPDLREITLQ